VVAEPSSAPLWPRPNTSAPACTKPGSSSGHPAWDTSEYDSYKITIKQDTADNFWLYVEPHGNWAAVANIEPIPAEEQLIQPPAIPDMTQLRLPAPVNDSDTELE
jgi:hypothetical protein